jgi:Ulp1 family protease
LVVQQARQNEKLARHLLERGFAHKDYVFLPIHYADHWSLVIITHPAGNDAKTGSFNFLLHLDSRKVMHNSKKIFETLWKVLRQVWQFGVGQDYRVPEDFKLPSKRVKISGQENTHDCGVFVLYSMQQFVQIAPNPCQQSHFIKDERMVSNPWILNHSGRFFQEELFVSQSLRRLTDLVFNCAV